MRAIKEIFKRVTVEYVKDIMSIFNEAYNESAGALKHFIVEPVVKRAVTQNEILPFGSYVKVTGTTYTLRLLGKAHDANRVYRINDLAVKASKVYIAIEDKVTGTFNVEKWREVADESVGPITLVAGSVVCNGKYHNNVNAAGFLVEDDSEIKIG